MEYNTQREKLNINDYGRIVRKMVQVAIGIPDRERRNKVARSIVATMAQVNPEAKDNESYEQSLWEHLMILSEGKLDVDAPYEINPRQELKFDPKTMTRKEGKVKYPHYGRSLEQMVDKVARMEQNEERDEMVDGLLRQMKLSCLQWNSATVEDEMIVRQFNAMTDGKIAVEEDRQISIEGNMLRTIASEKKMNKKKKRKK